MIIWWGGYFNRVYKLTELMKPLQLTLVFQRGITIFLYKMEQPSLITNLDLYVILKESGKLSNYIVLLNRVVSQLSQSLSDEDLDILKEFCRRFSQAVTKRWKQAKKNPENFKRLYANWLELQIDWPTCVTNTSGRTTSETLSDPRPLTSETYSDPQVHNL